jgi:hypothetical protein
VTFCSPGTGAGSRSAKRTHKRWKRGVKDSCDIPLLTAAVEVCHRLSIGLHYADQSICNTQTATNRFSRTAKATAAQKSTVWQLTHQHAALAIKQSAYETCRCTCSHTHQAAVPLAAACAAHCALAAGAVQGHVLQRLVRELQGHLQQQQQQRTGRFSR